MCRERNKPGPPHQLGPPLGPNRDVPGAPREDRLTCAQLGTPHLEQSLWWELLGAGGRCQGRAHGDPSPGGAGGRILPLQPAPSQPSCPGPSPRGYQGALRLQGEQCPGSQGSQGLGCLECLQLGTGPLLAWTLCPSARVQGPSQRPHRGALGTPARWGSGAPREAECCHPCI